MKRSLKLISILLCFLMIFSVSACQNSEPEKPTTNYYTVTFIYNNGEQRSSISVEEGKTAIAPAEPKKDSFIFEGWYSNQSLTIRYDFSSPVVKNTILYAKYKKVETFTVTLFYNAYSYLPIETYLIEKGKTFQTPSAILKNNYIFEGWYSNRDLTIKYDFSKPVTQNITLYAKYKLDGTAITNKISTDLIKGVVKVYNTSYNTFLGLTTESEVSQGSGFCFYIGNGYYYFLTNCHVAKKISGYSKQKLVVEDYQGNQYEAEIFKSPKKSSSAIDPAYDLACLKVKASSTNIKALTMESINPNLDEDVISLGAPKGQTNSITIGRANTYTMITLSNTPTYLSNVKFNVFCHTSLINNGSSGGPLLDSNLNVVGINYALASSGFGCAIPIEKVREFLNKYVYN